jgi:prephenate dehydrogenase/RimJ/RimL family protein N-acetyltransferase
MTNISHGIVGAAGDMGTSLRCLLSGTGGQVVGVDKDWPKSLNDWAKLWSCDVIWLAIEREAIDKMLKKKSGQLRPSQLVIDICSLKRGIAKPVDATGAEHLSLHPMHGPNIRQDRQKWFLIRRRDRISDRAKHILTHLESLGVTFLDADSEDDHDFKMGVVLGLKEIMTLVMDRLILAYAKDCGKKKPSIDALLKWSSPVANAVYGAYVHSVLRSSDRLRRELVDGSYRVPQHDGSYLTLRESASRALAKLATELTGLNLGHEFKNQRSRLKALQPARQLDISSHINTWFEDASAANTGDRQSSAVQQRSQHHDAMLICTKNLTLRPFKEADRADLVNILCDRKVMKWVFAGPLTKVDAFKFVDAHFVNASREAPGLGILCRAADGNFLGFAGIIPCKPPLDPKLEFGVVLTTSAQEEGGYGSEIGRKLIEIGLGQLPLRRLYALCHPANRKSIRWLKNIGMKPTKWVISNYQGNEPRRVFVIER